MRLLRHSVLRNDRLKYAEAEDQETSRDNVIRQLGNPMLPPTWGAFYLGWLKVFLNNNLMQKSFVLAGSPDPAKI